MPSKIEVDTAPDGVGVVSVAVRPPKSSARTSFAVGSVFVPEEAAWPILLSRWRVGNCFVVQAGAAMA